MKENWHPTHRSGALGCNACGGGHEDHAKPCPVYVAATKRLPTAVRPDKIAITQTQLVVCAGAETYQVDLDSFFAHVPWATLAMAYDRFYDEHKGGKAVKERIAETRRVACTCQDCAVCRGSKVICGTCGMCTRCHQHQPGCSGCPEVA